MSRLKDLIEGEAHTVANKLEKEMSTMAAHADDLRAVLVNALRRIAALEALKSVEAPEDEPADPPAEDDEPTNTEPPADDKIA